VGNLHDGVLDYLVDELSKLKQGSSLMTYLENFDNLLAKMQVYNEITLSFFFSFCN